ncbi:hypothetical protein EB001_08170 [bacterium]|nr:hypothetical protein [bacterium]
MLKIFQFSGFSDSTIDCSFTILKKFNNETLWGITLTSKKKIGEYYFTFEHDSGRESTANLSQLRLIDSKRLKYQIGTISENDFVELKKRIINLID